VYIIIRQREAAIRGIEIENLLIKIADTSSVTRESRDYVAISHRIFSPRDLSPSYNPPRQIARAKRSGRKRAKDAQLEHSRFISVSSTERAQRRRTTSKRRKGKLSLFALTRR